MYSGRRTLLVSSLAMGPKRSKNEETNLPKGEAAQAARSGTEWRRGHGGQELHYTPKAGAPASPGNKLSCTDCRHNDGSCQAACADVQKLVPHDLTGKGTREFSNELDMDRPPAQPLAPEPRDFSDLLEVPHIYSGKELALLRLLQSGGTRKEVCWALGVSSSRVSQLLGSVQEKYVRYEARLRALTLQEAKKLDFRTDNEAEEKL